MYLLLDILPYMVHLYRKGKHLFDQDLNKMCTWHMKTYSYNYTTLVITGMFPLLRRDLLAAHRN